LGLGYGVTSVIFLACILVAVCYLTVSRADVIAQPEGGLPQSTLTNTARERIMVGYFGLVAAGAAGLLIWAAGQPHSAPTASEEEGGGSATAAASLAPGQVSSTFPAADVTEFRRITQDTLTKVQTSDQAGAIARIKDLETSWDNKQSTLEAIDGPTWTALDGQIDDALHALRTSNPDVSTETSTLTTLLTSLR
jgi:hypothetical protein